jgi:hypothetical protein
MKAFDVLVFMVAFNLSLNAVILVAGEAAPPGQNMGWISSIFGVVETEGGLLILALGGAIAATSVTIIGTQVSRPVGVVAFAFAFFYSSMMISAMDTLSSFRVGEVQMIPPVFMGMLIVLNVGVFVAALMQIATGGWRSAN